MAGNDLIFVILIAISLSACCGLRAFLPLSALSVLAWTGHIVLAPSFDWLASPEAAVAFGLAALLEIVADKFPGLDNALDAAGVVIKPVAGALLASSIITGMDPVLAMSLGVIMGGTIAGTTHLAKAQLRLFSTGFTGGAGNPILSFAEDGTAVVGTALGILAPIVTGAVVILLVVWLLRRMARKRKLQEAAL